MLKKYTVFLFISISFFLNANIKEDGVSKILDTPLKWEKITEIPDKYGRAGSFTGYHNNALIIGGGSNFNELSWTKDAKKSYYDDFYVYDLKENRWITSEIKLPTKMGYGTSVSTKDGIFCFGGTDDNKIFDFAFLVKWDPDKKVLKMENLKNMPLPLCFTQATVLKNRVYIAGGKTETLTNTTEMTNSFICYQTDKNSWEDVVAKYNNHEIKNSFPGKERILAYTVMQSNGEFSCIYVFGGRQELPENKFIYFDDMWEYNTKKAIWTKKANSPVPIQAGSAIAVGVGHIFTLSGTNGKLIDKVVNKELHPADHPGFEKDCYAFFTINNTWIKCDDLPVNQLTTPVAREQGKNSLPSYIISGETKPKVRTPDVWKITIEKKDAKFGAINFTIIIAYFLLLIGVGIFFYFRNNTTEDFFKASGRVPFFVAAMSIFATMLSSITFIAVPGKAFATNWINFLLQISMFAVTPIVIYKFLPFFRKITSASAYEYLEKRFNLATRLFASSSFIIYHIGRMGLVMYLPALALSTILKLHSSPEINMMIAILIMGILSIIYCTIGGLEAVVWTDTIQGIILIFGALLTIIIIFFKVGGITNFFITAVTDNKFKLLDMDWSIRSYAIPCFWVILIGGFGQNLIPYSSDMSIIQRYMSVRNEDQAKKSIWTNTFVSIFASAIFFLVGTALYVFYKKFPANLDPVIDKIDYTFPVFIVRELPIGVAGIVVAAIFAAAQSTVSTSMNSSTAAIMSDFIERFNLISTEKSKMRASRILNFLFGATGVLTGIFFIYASSQSLWDQFMIILGLIGGAMCGLFCLGIFTKSSNGIGALIGAILGVVATILAGKFTNIHVYLYGVINIVITFISGFLFSKIFKNKKRVKY